MIFVEIKNVYGNDLIYPACEASRGFARIAGTNTLSEAAIAEIRGLGFTVVEQSKTKTLAPTARPYNGPLYQ